MQFDRDFRCVPLTVFRLHNNLNISIYTKASDQREPVLYRSPEIAITDADINELRRRGHHFVFVSAAEFGDFDREVNRNIKKTLADESVRSEDRFAILQAATALELDIAFELIRCDRFVELTHRISKQITTLISADRVLPRRLFDVLQHDYFTFNHVTNVAAFATLLADRMGYTEPKIREQIATGALLHDIGKRFIPAEVLNKRGKLSDDDWELIRSHPQRGYEDLCERDDLNEGQLMMVYSHHRAHRRQGLPRRHGR